MTATGSLLGALAVEFGVQHVEGLALHIEAHVRVELERSQQQFPERPDRTYATIVARAD